jgi:parvulin-like peptidyl-prolyl isomerase
VRELYLAGREQRHVFHLLLETREEAEKVLLRLKKGEKIPGMAAGVSKDPGASQNRGDLGWIKRGQTVPPFEAAAFGARVGEPIGPVQSKFGWHVLLVGEVKAPSDEEFERDRETASKEAAAMEMEMRRSKALVTLKSKYLLVADEKVLAKDRSTAIEPGDETLVAGRVKGEVISLAALKLFMAESLNSIGESHALGPQIKSQFLELMADNARLGAAAVEAGLDRRPEVQARLWEAEHEAGYAVFGRRYLATCEVPEGDLRKFHSGHAADFLGPGRVRLNLLVIDSQDFAELAAQEARAGVSWESLFQKYANREATGRWDLGWVEISDLQKAVPPEAIRSLLKRPVGGVVGPARGPEGYEVFQILEREPGPPLPFEACSEQVKVAYVETNGRMLLQAYLDGEGRKGITVRAYPENLPPKKG